MHIPSDELQKFQDGAMNTDEMIHFLEHMEQCDFCLEQMIQDEETSSEHAPAYLQDEILKKAASPEIQTSRKIHETAYWMKLLCTGLRTAVGMGVALIMLFSVSQTDFTALHPSPETKVKISSSLDIGSGLNQLSREICQEKPTHEAIKEKLTQIQNRPHYSFGMQLLIYALVSGSFSVFFGGDWKDMAASAIIGVLLKFIEAFVKKGSVNSLITALICSTVGGFLANLAVYSGIGDHADLISIGNIMLLIPGIAFTNSLRDMFSGDTITGLIRFMESILLALVIALGFTFAGFILG